MSTLSVVVLENSNMEKLASNPYLSVHSLPQEDHYDTDDASAGEVYAMLVPEARVCGVQSSRRRQHCPSVVARGAQAHRTAALYGLRPRVLCTGGHPDGPPHAPRSPGRTTGDRSAGGRL